MSTVVVGNSDDECHETDRLGSNDIKQRQDDDMIDLKKDSKVSKLRWATAILSIVVIVLLGYIIHVDVSNRGYGKLKDTNNIALGNECTINGTNVTSVIEVNLLANNESQNFSSLLLHEYLVAIMDDQIGSGNNNQDNTNNDDESSSQDVTYWDNHRRLQSCTITSSSSFGGSGGAPFSIVHPSNPCLNIKSVCVRSGSLLDAISATWTDGTASSSYGGGGGSSTCYTSPSGCISAVYVKSGSLIDGLLLVDSGGKISAYRGGSGGGSNSDNWGDCLKRIDGRSGSLVDQLRFYF